jgi:hypothetical protein
LVIKEYFEDLLQFDYHAVNEGGHFCGRIGDVEGVNVASVCEMILPDSMVNMKTLFFEYELLAKNLEEDVLLVGSRPAVNLDTSQTCIGFAYSVHNKSWFPLFLSEDKTFDECYADSSDGIAFKDVGGLMAYAFARIQGGLSKGVGETIMVSECAYDISKWIHLEMFTVVDS